MQGRLFGLTAALLISGVVMPGSSHAEDLAVTIRPRGLTQVADATVRFFPEQIAFDRTISKQLVDCPFTDEDTVATVDDIVGAVDWHDLALRVSDGNLIVDANIDLDLGVHLSAVNFYACFGSIDCNANLAATNLDVTATVALMSGEDGNVTFANSDLDLRLDMTDFELDSSGCVLGDLIESVSDFLGNWVLDRLQEPAEEKLSGIFAAKLAGLDIVLPKRIEKLGFQLEPVLNHLVVDEEGLQIAGDVGVVGPAGPVDLDLEAPTGKPLPTSFSDGGIALAASDRLVTQSLAEAYEAGMFTALLTEAVPTIELSQDGLAQKLGLPAGTTIDVGLDISSAPVVSFGRGDTLARVALPDMQVDIMINSPGSPQGLVSVNAAALLNARFKVTDGAMGVSIEDMVMERLTITAEDTILEPDPVRLQRFIRDVGVPMLSARLGDLPLAPVMQPINGAFVWLRGVEAGGGWLRMGIDLILPDPRDDYAPETTLPEVRMVSAGMASIPVAGNDNTTPLPLLRYMAWFDGEPLTEEPAAINKIQFSASDGEHVLEVAAVDLNGNMDDTPSRLELLVDGTPPELVVESHPEPVVDGAIAASWRALDDKGNAKTRWEIRVAKNGAVQEIVAQGEGGANGSLEVDALDRGNIYVLHLIAEDEAGNTTSEEFGFAYEQGGGCSAAGGGGGAWLVGLFLLAGMLRRRRKRVATVAASAAAVFAFSLVHSVPTASAQSAGSSLSGATDADGGSAFWNPAAMVAGEGTMFDLTGSLTFIRIGYDNPATPGSSSTAIPKPQPTLGAISDALGEKVRIGFTLGVPYASGAKWDPEDPEGQTTRYYTADALIVHAMFTPSIAYKVTKKIAFGAGLNIDYASISAAFDKDFAAKLNASVGGSADSPFVAGTPELAAPVEFSMDGFGVGAVGGLLVEPNERIKIGVSIHSPISARATGDLEADYPEAMTQFIQTAVPGAELPDVEGEVAVDLEVPLSAFASVAVVPAPTWEVVGEYRFVNYSRTSNSDIIISKSTSPDLQDTQLVRGNTDRHSVGLRTSKSLRNNRALLALKGRFENNYVSERTYTPSNLDFKKFELAAAVRWQLGERVSLVAQYSKFFLFDEIVTESLHQPLADPNLDVYNHPAPLGTYTGGADLVAVGVTMNL